MKNKAFILAAFVLLCQASYAGTKLKLGLRLSPAVSFAGIRDKDNDDAFTYSSNGIAGRAILGPMAEIFMTDNASFGLGLWYTPKSVSLTAKSKSDGSTYSSSYNLQYLMVPVYLKFYTNPITPKMKLYFTLGATLDVKIAEKAGANTSSGGGSFFNPIDASLMVGAGTEFALSESTAFFVGLGYNRGLLNVINPVNYRSSYDALAIKNNLVSLDLGVKF
jgi:hypothetical protein